MPPAANAFLNETGQVGRGSLEDTASFLLLEKVKCPAVQWIFNAFQLTKPADKNWPKFSLTRSDHQGVEATLRLCRAFVFPIPGIEVS